MRRRITAAALLLGLGLTQEAAAGAFEVKTSQGTLPKKENKRPLSLPRQFLRVDVTFEGTRGTSGFNNAGDNACDPLLAESGCSDVATSTPSFLLTIPDGDEANGSLAHNVVETVITRFDLQYGLTENWTFGVNVPVVSAREVYVANPGREQELASLLAANSLPERTTNTIGNTQLPATIGDMRLLLQYQFLRTYEGPMRALVGRIHMKMPTGNESPGSAAKQFPGDNPDTPEIEDGFVSDVRVLIAGTGTTDADLGLSYKQEITESLALTGDAGYVVRFPDFVGYLFDEPGVQFADGLRSSAKLDLGDQLYVRGRLTVSPSEKWFGTLDLRASRWAATRVARARLVADQTVQIDENTQETRNIFLGPQYLDLPDSAGFLVSTTPRVVYRPNNWLEFGLSTDLHLFGKNTNYVRSNNVTQQDPEATRFGEVGEEENNFYALQALGVPLGPMILGTTKLGVTFTY